MFCSKNNMFGFKNIANILGATKHDAFAQPLAPSSSDSKVVSGSSENMFAKSADAKDVKENVKALTKVPRPIFPKQTSLLVPTVMALSSIQPQTNL
jgi:hypothetical protein